jgi:chemotaxis protein histidine kinase CheA
MDIAQAISGLKLNLMDDDLYQALLRGLDEIPVSDSRFNEIRDIFAKVKSGALSFLDFENALDTIDLSIIGSHEIGDSANMAKHVANDADDINPSILATFLDEVEGHIDTLVSALGQIDPNLLSKLDFNGLFRAAHTIKGSSASVGLMRLSACIHEFEDLLASQRNAVNLEAVQFPAIEAFVKLLARSLPILKRGEFDNVPYLLLKKLVNFALALEPLPADIIASVNTTLAQGQPATNDMLRISAVRIGGLFNEVERLQSMLADTDRIFQELIADGSIQGHRRRKLSDLLSAERMITNQLQRELISFRLVPFRQLLPRMRRVIDEYCLSTGKEIELTVSGEMVEIKKAVLDRLSDILLHLLKNAMDHGIESSSERTAINKDSRGRIQVAAKVKRSQIVISVRDDGRGIDTVTVLKKAVEKGLIKGQEAGNLDDKAVIDLLFLPGFSTAEKVTSISGRGVGMDAVKTMVGDLGGKLVMTSKLGSGSAVELTFPADVSVEEVVLIENCGQTYAILLSSIEVIIPLYGNDRASLALYPYYETRDELIPVIGLNELITPGSHAKSSNGLLLLKEENMRLALAVERVLRKDQVIVSPPPSAYLDAKHISGIFTLDDAGLCAILNPGELLVTHRICIGTSKNAA